MTISSDGAVLEAVEVKGTLVIAARHVQIRLSRLVATGEYGVQVEAGGDVAITDSDLSGSSQAVIAFSDWSCTRCRIHDFADDGVKLGNRTTLADSFITSFMTAPGNHSDGGQLQDGAADVVVRHNTILATGTGAEVNSALFIAPDMGSGPGPVEISENLVAGGNYTIYIVDGSGGRYLQKQVNLGRNRFVQGSSRFGPLDISDLQAPFVTASGNVWDQDNRPIGAG